MAAYVRLCSYIRAEGPILDPGFFNPGHWTGLVRVLGRVPDPIVSASGRPCPGRLRLYPEAIGSCAFQRDPIAGGVSPLGAIPRIAERLSAALCGAPDGAPMWGSTIISGVVNPLSIFQNRGPDGVTLRTSRITLDMATKVYVSV